MGKMHIKTGDDVIVIAGKEKGKKAKLSLHIRKRTASLSKALTK